ncbi:MAG: efflux transporter outer membrane subunit [Rhodospirillaceae bacterium]
MIKRVSGLGIALLALAGCSVGEEFKRPETPMPAKWAVSNGDAVSAAKEAWPAADWWRSFGSRGLDTLMAEAEKANFDMAAAVARVRQADAKARIAGASLLPALDASGNANRQLQPSLSGGSGASAKPAEPQTIYTGTINASYELDFWGKNAATRASAAAAAQASRFDRQTVALTVQAGVANSWFAVLGLQDRLAVARANLANTEDLLAAIRDRVKFGTATDLDLAQQESVVAGLRAAVPPLEQQLREQQNALAVLVGHLPEQAGVALEPLSAVKIPVVVPGLTSDLLARRPDVRFAEANLVAANADINAAKAALFPSITLTARAGFESLALSTLLHGSNLLYSMAAGISQPIFHGGALEGEEESLLGRYDELVQTYRKAVVSAFSDVENALIAVRKTAEEEEAQALAVSTARRAFEIATAQFKAGLVDIVTMLNTQRTLFQARDAEVQVRISRLQAVVGLFKALGGGWRSDITDVMQPSQPSGGAGLSHGAHQDKNT